MKVLQYSQGLADNTVIAKVNGELWDLDRPLEEDCELKLLKFDDPEGQYVFWHSSAHILGEAMERHYGGHLCYGPPIENGFYYDMWIDDRSVAPADFPNLDQIVKKIQKDKQPFERLEMKKEDLLKMFEVQSFVPGVLHQIALCNDVWLLSLNQTSFYFSIISLNKGSLMSASPLPLPRCTDVDHSSICVVDPMYDTPERLRPCILPRQECFLLFYYIRNPKYRIMHTFKQEYSNIPN